MSTRNNLMKLTPWYRENLVKLSYLTLLGRVVVRLRRLWMRS